MRKPLVWIVAGFILGIGASAFFTHHLLVYGQLTERPGNSNDPPIDVPRDLSGLSVKNPRTRVVNTTDPWQEGGSMYLQEVDPWLGYQKRRSGHGVVFQ